MAVGDGPAPAVGAEGAPAVVDVLSDPQRIAAVEATGLTSSRDEVLDGYCRLVRRVLGVPVALVSLVDADRQLLPGVVGLGGWAEELRETPLTHAMCQVAVRTGTALVVTDTRLDPAMRNQPAVTELNVIAYLGIPLVSAEGQVLGALCAIDREPRQWSDDDLATLTDLAGAVSSELRLRVANSRARRLHAEAAQSSARTALVAAISELLTGRLDEVDGLAELARSVVPLLADWAVVDALDGDRLVRIEVAHRDLELPATMRRQELPADRLDGDAAGPRPARPRTARTADRGGSPDRGRRGRAGRHRGRAVRTAGRQPRAGAGPRRPGPGARRDDAGADRRVGVLGRRGADRRRRGAPGGDRRRQRPGSTPSSGAPPRRCRPV